MSIHKTIVSLFILMYAQSCCSQDWATRSGMNTNLINSYHPSIYRRWQPRPSAPSLIQGRVGHLYRSFRCAKACEIVFSSTWCICWPIFFNALGPECIVSWLRLELADARWLPQGGAAGGARQRRLAVAAGAACRWRAPAGTRAIFYCCHDDVVTYFIHFSLYFPPFRQGYGMLLMQKLKSLSATSIATEPTPITIYFRNFERCMFLFSYNFSLFNL